MNTFDFQINFPCLYGIEKVKKRINESINGFNLPKSMSVLTRMYCPFHANLSLTASTILQFLREVDTIEIKTGTKIMKTLCFSFVWVLLIEECKYS